MISFCRRGFSLIEVMVGLVIGAMALGAAATALVTMTDRLDGIRRISDRRDRDANGEIVLRHLFENLDFRTSREAALVGSDLELRWKSWCDGVRGWPVPCTGRLFFDGLERRTLILVFSTYGPDSTLQLELRHGSYGEFRYLRDPGGGGLWTDRWSDLVPPRAVGVILGADTLFLTVGGHASAT